MSRTGDVKNSVASIFSFERKMAAKKGLKPEEKEESEDQSAAEERRKEEENEAQTDEATFGKEKEAQKIKI